MTTQNEFQHTVPGKSPGTRALQGAGLAFILVAIFLTVIFPIGGVLAGKGFWQGAWQFFPLLTTSIGGAFGGLFYFVMVDTWHPVGWKKVMVTVICVLAYAVALWLSLVAGFAATGQWD